MLTVGSLFSGAGCGDLGLEWAGFHHKWFCEVDDYARKVLAIRFPGKPIYGDIQAVDFNEVEPVDVLIGGFPCQDVSVAGKGKGVANGKRSGLWSEFARAIRTLRPRYVVIENSPMLANRGLDIVLRDLAEMWYNAEWQCISAAAFNAPHIRDRMWIVAYPKGIHAQGQHDGQGKVEPWRGAWWKSEPRLGRVVDGTPHRVERCKCIGNGHVPHCTYFIGQCVLRAEGLTPHGL